MRKKQMRLKLRQYAGKPKSASSRKDRYAEQLKGIASRRNKISDELKTLNSGMVNSQQLQQAGMLAHYALLFMILGSMLKETQKKIYLKELEKLGDRETGVQDKIEQLKLFETNSKEIHDLGKKIEKLDDDKRAPLLPKMDELVRIRDEIAGKLKLSPVEYSELLKAFDGHHQKLLEAKSQGIDPISHSIDSLKSATKTSPSQKAS